MSDREFVESEQKKLEILENEKKSIELSIKAFEEATTTKLDAKSDKQLTYYKDELLKGEQKMEKIIDDAKQVHRDEVTRANERLEKSIKEANKNFDSYRMYINGQIQSIMGKQLPEPERIVKYRMKLSSIEHSVFTKRLLLANFEVVSRPSYVPQVVIPAKTWTPNAEAIAAEAECARLRSMQVREVEN